MRKKSTTRQCGYWAAHRKGENINKEELNTEEKFLLTVSIGGRSSLYGQGLRMVPRNGKKGTYTAFDVYFASYANIGAACFSKKALAQRFFDRMDVQPSIEVVTLKSVMPLVA